MVSIEITTPGVMTGQRCTMVVVTDILAPYKYVWKKDGVFLAGTDSSNKVYTTWILTPPDMKAFYSVVVYGQENIEESGGIQIQPPPPPPPVPKEEKTDAVANLVPRGLPEAK